MIRTAIALALALPALAACSTGSASSALATAGAYPEATPFDAATDPGPALAQALATAQAQDRLVLVVYGANWCHDSRALAGWLETPRFAALVADAYEVVFIEAGVPQTGEGRHLDIAADLGVTDITGTPTLLVLGSDGALLNSPENARAWRNAASRSEDEIYSFLESFTAQGG